MRLAELDERLKASEAERNQANAIANDPYELFENRIHIWDVSHQKNRRKAPPPSKPPMRSNDQDDNKAQPLETRTAPVGQPSSDQAARF
jgi:hypothetical protein